MGARPMTWHFSDGTVAHRGGKIEGGTSFAVELRRLLREKPLVQLRPIPDEPTELDVHNPTMFDLFLRTEMDRPCNRWMMVSLAKAPPVPALEIPDPPAERTDVAMIH